MKAVLYAYLDRSGGMCGRYARDWAAKWRLVRRLRKEKFDLAVLLPNSFESAAVVDVGRQAGVAGSPRRRLDATSLARSLERHAVDRAHR